MNDLIRKIRKSVVEMRNNGIPESDITVLVPLDKLLEIVDSKWMVDWEWDEKDERYFCPNCRFYPTPKNAPLTTYCPSCGSYMRKTWNHTLNTMIW